MSRRDSQNTRTHTKNEDTEEAALSYCTRTGSGALRKNLRYVYKIASCFSYRLLEGVEHWISRPTLRFCGVPQVRAQQLKPALVHVYMAHLYHQRARDTGSPVPHILLFQKQTSSGATSVTRPAWRSDLRSRDQLFVQTDGGNMQTQALQWHSHCPFLLAL